MISRIPKAYLEPNRTSTMELHYKHTTCIPRWKNSFCRFSQLELCLDRERGSNEQVKFNFSLFVKWYLLWDVSFNHLGQVLCILLYLRHFLILWYFLKAHSRSEKSFGNCKLFKNDEKCFLFHLKSSLRSIDIRIFILTFWSCR